ncbi:unnamed protein product [Prunus armeniaca]
MLPLRTWTTFRVDIDWLKVDIESLLYSASFAIEEESEGCTRGD